MLNRLMFLNNLMNNGSGGNTNPLSFVGDINTSMFGQGWGASPQSPALGQQLQMSQFGNPFSQQPISQPAPQQGVGNPNQGVAPTQIAGIAPMQRHVPMPGIRGPQQGGWLSGGGWADTDMGMRESMQHWASLNPQQQQEFLKQKAIDANMPDAYINDPARSWNQPGG